MASFVLNKVISQLPTIVEKYEPELENGLRNGLKTLKTDHPDEARIFLANWLKINKAVQQELMVYSRGANPSRLAPLQIAASRRVKRTRTRRHRK